MIWVCASSVACVHVSVFSSAVKKKGRSGREHMLRDFTSTNLTGLTSYLAVCLKKNSAARLYLCCTSWGFYEDALDGATYYHSHIVVCFALIIYCCSNGLSIVMMHISAIRAEHSPLSPRVITEPTHQSTSHLPLRVRFKSKQQPADLLEWLQGNSAWVSDAPENLRAGWLASRASGWLTGGMSGQIIFLTGGEHEEDMLRCSTLGKPSKCVGCGCEHVCWCVGGCVFAHECRHCLIAVGWKRRARAHSNRGGGGGERQAGGEGRKEGRGGSYVGRGYRGDSWGVGRIK